MHFGKIKYLSFPVMVVLLSSQIFLFPIAQYAQAEDITGKVVGVHDGDTITVLTPEKRQIKVRLAQIDTPESAQPYGEKAKQNLSNLVFSKSITVKKETTDKYGRTVGTVFLDGQDINRAMVRGGHAWVYRDYLKDKSLLDDEAYAKNTKLGLWSLPESEQTPPWEWRHGKAGKKSRGDVSKAAKAPTSSSSFTCGGKRYCKEMTSCEEAKFFLAECGLSRLDGDGDGRPCETICR